MHEGRDRLSRRRGQLSLAVDRPAVDSDPREAGTSGTECQYPRRVGCQLHERRVRAVPAGSAGETRPLVTSALTTGHPMERSRAIRHVEHVMGTVVDDRPLHRRRCIECRALPERRSSACHPSSRRCSVQHLEAGEPYQSSSPRADHKEEGPPEVAEVLDLSAIAGDVSAGWFDPWAMPGGVDPTGFVKGWAAQRALPLSGRVGYPGR